jgi:hypothetical protein
MALDLSSYTAIQSNLFVRLTIDEYRTGTSGSYTSQVLKFCDRQGSYTIGSDTYNGLGNLMAVTSTSSEIRVSGQEVTVTVSGIPETSINEIVNSKIKGSQIIIYRVLFNPTTNVALSISGNPAGRFTGFVTNYSLTEEYDILSRTSTNTISFHCASVIDVLANTASGRRTNPEDQKSWYPSDLSMDRVPSLAKSNFNFGATT